MPTFRNASAADLPEIIRLLHDDEIGSGREAAAAGADPAYAAAFESIERDENNHVLVAEQGGRVVGCMQITYTPSLTRRGTLRATIEGVRVRSDARGGGIGTRMFRHAFDLARRRGCGIVQLTTDVRRPEALRFYERLGMRPTHVGMKMPL